MGRLSLLLALASLLAGCAQSSSAWAHESLAPDSSGRRFFVDAHGAWDLGMQDPTQPIEPLLAARGALRLAQRTDAQLPLYYSQEGLVALELAQRYGRLERGEQERQRYLELAELAFATSVELCPLWGPGHRGLAELALLQGRFEEARGHRRAERLSRATLVLAWRTLSPSLAELPFRQATRVACEPLQGSPEARLALLRSQLEEADRWTAQPLVPLANAQVRSP